MLAASAFVEFESWDPGTAGFAGDKEHKSKLREKKSQGYFCESLEMFAVLCAGAQCTRQNVSPSLYTRHYGMHIPSHHFAWTTVDGVVCAPPPAWLRARDCFGIERTRCRDRCLFCARMI